MNDIIIIGCGPIGLYSAFLCSLHNLNGLVIESLNQVGGQLTSLYPEKDIVDLAGVEKIKAKDFIDLLYNQYQKQENKLPIHLNEKVLEISKIEDGYQIKTNLDTYKSKTVLLTTGMGSFSPRLIGLENEKELKNIHYSCNDVSIYQNKDVVVLGGGDSAVDLSLLINQVSNSTTIIHRRDEFRAQDNSVNQMRNSSIKVKTNKNLLEVKQEGSKMNIKISGNKDDRIEEIICDYILVQYGQVPSKDNFPIEKVNNLIITKDYYQTSLENVFACGNIITYPGKVANITSGLGEACTIITRIDQIIHPGKNVPRHF